MEDLLKKVWLNKRQGIKIRLKKAFMANIIWVVVFIISLFVLAFISASLISLWILEEIDYSTFSQIESIIYHVMSIFVYILNFLVGIIIMSLIFKHNLFENVLTVVCIIITERTLVYMINGIGFFLIGFFPSNGIHPLWS